MRKEPARNAFYAQSGGVSAVINASACGVIETAQRSRRIGKLFAGRDGIVEAFLKAAVYGTPDRILRALEERRAAVGEFELCTSFRFGGTPYKLAEQSLSLYAKEILPVLQSWKDATPAAKDAAK